MLFQKYDPRIEYFNKVIDTARDNGLIDYYLGKDMPAKNMKEPVTVRNSALVLEHLLLPLILSTTCLIVALLTFAIECFSSLQTFMGYNLWDISEKTPVFNLWNT